MKFFQAWLLSTLWVSSLAAPAVVWKKAGAADRRSLHNSDSIAASDLLQNALEDISPADSSKVSVVFLVNKGQDGSESLTELASSGKLPETANKYNDANAIYHHVSGIESMPTMVRAASRANDGHNVLQVSVGELNSKVTSQTKDVEISESATMEQSSKRANKRSRDIATSNVLLVLLEPKDEIDTVITNTIDNENVEAVVLAGIRSSDEVKHERYLMSKRRRSIMEKQGKNMMEARRRRLEEEGGEQGGDEDGDNDMSGVYFVSMTPNILAGLLFGFFFVTVTFIGITCMGAISGQDVYVSKMPTIGREA
eukprot:scaffold674_cov126-Cylindrotheca_fusiformis.AAC.9